MLFTIHWNVNDGRSGYPNIAAELYWSQQTAPSYIDAIVKHARLRGAVCYGSWVSNITEIGKGKINGVSYRDFSINYCNSKDSDIKIVKEIRVFANKS